MKEKDDVKQVFSKNKEAYISSSTHASGNDLVEMIEWLQPAPTMNALDIATGGGHVAKHLAKHLKEIIATDLTEAMLANTTQHLQSYKNITFAVADAEDLPFANNTFDIVTCRIAAHHFPNPETFISEVKRVLKPDGQFLFIDNIAPENRSLDEFNNTLEKMRDYSHVRSRSISEWKKILRDNDLTIVRENARKKTLPYQEWIERTLDNHEDMNKVDRFIRDASDLKQEYFQVMIKNTCIQSFAIDEWMVLVKK